MWTADDARPPADKVQMQQQGGLEGSGWKERQIHTPPDTGRTRARDVDPAQIRNMGSGC
jgi:hypothetical protein